MVMLTKCTGMSCTKTLSLCWPIEIKTMDYSFYSAVSVHHLSHNNFFMFQAICGPESWKLFMQQQQYQCGEKKNDAMGYFTSSQWFFNLMAHFGIQLEPLHFIDCIEALLSLFRFFSSAKETIPSQLFIFYHKEKRTILFKFIWKKINKNLIKLTVLYYLKFLFCFIFFCPFFSIVVVNFNRKNLRAQHFNTKMIALN